MTRSHERLFVVPGERDRPRTCAHVRARAYVCLRGRRLALGCHMSRRPARFMRWGGNFGGGTAPGVIRLRFLFSFPDFSTARGVDSKLNANVCGPYGGSLFWFALKSAFCCLKFNFARSFEVHVMLAESVIMISWPLLPPVKYSGSTTM